MEFDLLILDTEASTTFELGSIQAGIMVDPSIYNGGTISASIVPGTSMLNPSQQPSSILFSQSQNCIKLAPKAPPGIGNGTILSVDPFTPTRVCRIRIINTVPFAQAQPNLDFSFNSIPYPTKVSQYIGGLNTALITNTTNCFSQCANNLLNPPPVLSVSPSDQTVTAQDGTTTFEVSSNAGWVAESDQTWCSVTPSGFGSGTMAVTYTQNNTTSPRVATITVFVNGLPPVTVTITQNGILNKTLNLMVLLEGLYAGSGMMNPAMDENGFHWGGTIADKISVELRESNNYSSVAYSASNIDLNTNGTATVTFPSSISGMYYITIRHRNCIETVSASPLSFAESAFSYAFDHESKAYGGNIRQTNDGSWVIWCGDANQDGLVDSTDMILIDNDASDFQTGYLVTDLNGDGLVDSSDMVVVDNNASLFISSVTP